MNLNNRFKTEFLMRITQELPQTPQWKIEQLSCVIESLEFSIAEGIKASWQQTAAFEGRLRVEVLSADLQNKHSEPFIDNLLNHEIILLPDEGVNTGNLSEQGRFIFRNWSNVVTKVEGIDTLIVSIDFDVQGSLVKKIAIENRPDIYLSQAPKIGLVHKDDYVPIDEYLQNPP